MGFKYILEARDVSYVYGRKDGDDASLKGVSLGIREGVRTVILGANGAGKSTLFYHFNGVFKPTEGQLFYRGIPMSYQREHLHELREEAMDLRDSVQRAYFQQAVVTHELRIPSGQSLVVGGGDGYGYLIRLCVDGQPVENLTLGSSVVLGEETVLSGHMVLKLSGCMDEDGDYGVVVT